MRCFIFCFFFLYILPLSILSFVYEFYQKLVSFLTKYSTFWMHVNHVLFCSVTCMFWVSYVKQQTTHIKLKANAWMLVLKMSPHFVSVFEAFRCSFTQQAFEVMTLEYKWKQLLSNRSMRLSPSKCVRAYIPSTASFKLFWDGIFFMVSSTQFLLQTGKYFIFNELLASLKSSLLDAFVFYFSGPWNTTAISTIIKIVHQKSDQKHWNSPTRSQQFFLYL